MVWNQHLILILLIGWVGYLQFHSHKLGMLLKSSYMQMKFEAKKSVREQGVQLVCIFKKDVQPGTQSITEAGSGVH